MDNTYLIAGLGNPGPKYDNNRHNIGFLVLDELVRLVNASSWQSKFNGLYTKIRIGSATAILLKPQTFMNLSGQSISKAAAFFKIKNDNILVVHDEIELDFDTLRLKFGGGTAGHNGLKSCKQEMGTADFIRLRIGVGRPKHGDVSNYVLSDFSSDEKINLGDVIDRACESIKCVTTSGLVKAMNLFNKRQGDN